jgi:hypothetical protein
MWYPVPHPRDHEAIRGHKPKPIACRLDVPLGHGSHFDRFNGLTGGFPSGTSLGYSRVRATSTSAVVLCCTRRQRAPLLWQLR